MKNMSNKYFIMASENPDRMLLSGMPEANPEDPFTDDWLFGARFSIALAEPIVAIIQQVHEAGELLPYFDAQPIVSNEFYQALLEAGVNNLDVYDCILQSEDGKIQHKGFKAINIIGAIKASRAIAEFCGNFSLTDTSMNKLDIDENEAGGALMFRLAENLSTVIVHEKVKKHLESKSFPSIVFRDLGDLLIL